MKILIIEDEDIIASMLSDTLELSGHHTMIASSGKEGLARARQFKPDIITLDLNMPGMDGFEVLEQLKGDESTKNIPVFISSVKNDRKSRESGFKLGADKYFAKPFLIEDMEQEITELAV